eukprot:67177_1
MSSITCSFIKLSLYIMLLFVFSIIWWLIAEYFDTHGSQKYLYGYWDTVLIFFYTICVITMLLLAIESLLKSQITALITNKMLISLLIVLYILSLVIALTTRNTLIQINIFNHYSAICDYLSCADFNIFYIYLHIFIPGVLPFILFIIWYGCYHKKINEITSSKNDNENKLEMSLLENTQYSDQLQNQQTIVSSTRNVYLCISFLSMYCASICAYYCQIFINRDKMTNNFDFCYIEFAVWCSAFKFMMKIIGRKCDRHREIFKSQQYAISNYLNCLSIESLVEWIFSVSYWIWLREFIAYHSFPSWTEYITVTFLHFLSESVETNVKFTALYFKLRSKTEHFARRSSMMMFYKLIGSNNDIIEYRNRLSINVMIRFYAAIIVSTFQILIFIIDGQIHFESNYGENTYYRCLLYLTVSTTLEFVHYILSIIWIHKLCKFNILTVFMNDYLSTITKSQCYFTFLIY